MQDGFSSLFQRVLSRHNFGFFGVREAQAASGLGRIR